MPRERETLEIPHGGRDLVDEGLLREAVDRVNQLVTRRGLRGVVRLGRFLLETFFGGEVGRFRAEGETDPSWRALVSDPRIVVAHSTLWAAVRTVGQLEELGPVGRKLSPTHHRRLFAVDDLPVKRLLARRSVAEGWSSRQLEAAIAAERGQAVRRAPSAWRGLERKLSTLDASEVSVDQLRELGPRRLRRLEAQLREAQEALAGLRTTRLAFNLQTRG